MFRALPFAPLVSPPGSCTITVRSLMGTDLYVEAWLAADLSLLKEALMPVFHCSAEQMNFFLPASLFASLPASLFASHPSRTPLHIHTWIRRLPVIGNTRLIYLAIEDEAPNHVRILVPAETIHRK